ncbi:hypothetical protein [Rhodococcus sp. NPDC058521]|uniref:hypothetical protein n=1 Tax=Rhodococcus sp. NPDC058521 TaxID=3346536 RepID=UPI003664F1AE
MDDDAAAQCVAICDRIIEKFDDAIDETVKFEKISGFGGFDSAQQLERGFAEKLIHSPASVKNRLVQHRDAVKLLRSTFEANGRGFEDTESEFYQKLQTIVSGENL